MKQLPWSKAEVLSLMNFVSGEKNIKDAVQLWVQENPHRTFNGSQFQYYNQKRIQEGNPYGKNYQANKTKNQNMKQEDSKGALSSSVWTEDHIRDLKRYVEQKLTPDQMAEKLHRSRNSITSKLFRMSQEKPKPTEKKTFTPLSTYLKEHNLVHHITDESKTVEEKLPVKTETISLLRGSEIMLPITAMRIEDGNLILTL